MSLQKVLSDMQQPEIRKRIYSKISIEGLLFTAFTSFFGLLLSAGLTANSMLVSGDYSKAPALMVVFTIAIVGIIVTIGCMIFYERYKDSNVFKAGTERNLLQRDQMVNVLLGFKATELLQDIGSLLSLPAKEFIKSDVAANILKKEFTIDTARELLQEQTKTPAKIADLNAKG